MTMWLRWSVLVALLHITFSEFEPNVCPTYRDYITLPNNKNCWYDFAAADKVPQIIQKTGYPFMEYKVKTKDGYILTVFRIPSITQHKPPVFILHGVQCTSGIFVGSGKNSLAFLLADSGYDVWLGNYRGTEYSEGHESLNASQREYWNYGADEIALRDVPAMLGLVTYHSGYRGKIIYIGHSLGTTAGLMYSSEYPEHAKKTVQLFIFLSPAYKLSNMRSPYRFLLPFLGISLRLTNDLNVVQLVSRGTVRRLTRSTCLASPALMLGCLGIVNLFVGPLSQTPPERVPVMFNQLPGGTSLKTLTYISEAVRGRFKKFDYGGRNRFYYGTDTPPEYNISKIQVPVYIMYSRNDWSTTKTDSINLYRTLPKEVRYGIFEVASTFFNHLDFAFGRNAKSLVYDPLLSVIENFNPNKITGNEQSPFYNKL